MTPLISSRSSFNIHRDQTNSASTKPTSRMGHAIGYIREKNSNPSNFGNSMMSSRSVVGINDTKSEKHEYHSISDNEDDDFFKPLDLGPYSVNLDLQIVIKLATTMVITSNFRQPRKVVIQKRTLKNVLATLSIFDDIKRSNWPLSNLSKLLMKKLLNQPLQWPMPWQANPCTILIRNPWNSFTNIVLDGHQSPQIHLRKNSASFFQL